MPPRSKSAPAKLGKGKPRSPPSKKLTKSPHPLVHEPVARRMVRRAQFHGVALPARRAAGAGASSQMPSSGSAVNRPTHWTHTGIQIHGRDAHGNPVATSIHPVNVRNPRAVAQAVANAPRQAPSGHKPHVGGNGAFKKPPSGKKPAKE